MRVKILIATVDSAYAKLFSDNISESHASIFEVSVCNTLENIQETLSKRKYDVALMDAPMIENADLKSIHLPMLLWSEHETTVETPIELLKINKHRRISSIVATVLERYAKISKHRYSLGSESANITAVWSPAGGVGKTTIALAYAASKVSAEKEVFYLNLEAFSSLPGYFGDSGKSISAVFEMLDDREGNVKMLIQGIRCNENGITYLSRPDNYDDMCILSAGNIKELVTTCAELADELVIDLSCSCDVRTRQVFELVDSLLIVIDHTTSAEVKLAQFASQNTVFENDKEKTTLVANKGAAINGLQMKSIISLPLVQTNDAVAIYKELVQRI